MLRWISPSGAIISGLLAIKPAMGLPSLWPRFCPRTVGPKAACMPSGPNTSACISSSYVLPVAFSAMAAAIMAPLFE